MPNTDPPILTSIDALMYYQEIRRLEQGFGFEPLMAIQITHATTPKIVAEARAAGVVVGKIDTKGITTNSENGVSNYRKIYPALREMQNCGMVCSMHGEKKCFCMDREEEFLPTLFRIADRFHRLKIVLEHITTIMATNAVTIIDNAVATITPHHLLHTTDDILGGKLKPHNFCKPIAKRPEDREQLLVAATSGSPNFFLDTDSAPHLKKNK